VAVNGRLVFVSYEAIHQEQDPTHPHERVDISQVSSMLTVFHEKGQIADRHLTHIENNWGKTDKREEGMEK